MNRVREVIEANEHLFDSNETIAVDPACEFVAGKPDWNRPYIGVIARRPHLLLSRLPASLASIPIRVVAATMEEQASHYRAAYQHAVTSDLLASEWRTGFLTSLTEAPRNYSRLTYRPLEPPHLPLVNEPMKLIAHVSPDAGWPTLRAFLNGGRQWSIAMFDFTARHIYDRLSTAIDPATGTLSLCLGPNESGSESSRPTGISEGNIVDGLRDVLGNRFHFAWASVGIQRQFPSAYHIKVAVKDRSSLWLSSGNWQSSNQPNRDFTVSSPEPVASEARDLAKTNREWHVVIENATLAGIFADYIDKDRESSEMDGTNESPLLETDSFPTDHELTMEFRVPDSPLLAEEEAARLPHEVFPAFVHPGDSSLSVQPILTPDNYAEHVLALIQSAQHRLWFQNQSLVIGRNVVSGYRTLLDALREKCWQIDDSRIIIRDLIRVQTLDVLRLLERDGFPMHKVRVMKTCHTKGILVDSHRTLLGSHNWTNEGTLYNRDASVLIDDGNITAYFERILDHDWRYLAVHLDVNPAEPSAILPLPGEIIVGERLTLDPRLAEVHD